MRHCWINLWAGLCVASSLLSAAEVDRTWPEPLHEDANLFDLCFVDVRHGWAVGDRGTILHTRDGGQTWNRQVCPVTCRLESVQFIDDRQGWIVGGYSSAYTHRPIGVVLRTEDGGQTWKELEGQFLPWLTHIQLLDSHRGFALGFPSAMFPSAVFYTRDGGQHWSPWPGRSTGWIHGQFLSPQAATLLDRQGRLFSLDATEIRSSDEQLTDPRLPLRICLTSTKRGLLCGNQGFVSVSGDTGRTWQMPRSLPSASVLAEFDWLAVDGIEQQFWVGGVPGSRILHTTNGGQSWELQETGHQGPLFGLEFVDSNHGWAVGALGAILHTADGGRTWSHQRGQGKRLAALGIYGHPGTIPWELWSQICAGDDALGAIEILSAPYELHDEPGRIPLSSRLHEAMVLLGGAGANLIQSIRAPDLQCPWSAEQVLDQWNDTIKADCESQLTEYLVRQIRLWRPELIVLAGPTAEPTGLTQTTHRLVLQAVEQAADSEAFPQQIQSAGLSVWRVPRVGTQTDKLEDASYKAIASRQALAWGQSIGTIANRARTRILDSFEQGAPHVGLVVAGGRPLPSGSAAKSSIAAFAGSDRQATHRGQSRLPSNVQQLHEQFQLRRTIEALLDGSEGIPATRLAQVAQVADRLSPADRGEVYYQSAMQIFAAGNAELSWELLNHLALELPDHPLAEIARLELLFRAASTEATMQWPQPNVNRAEVTVGQTPTTDTASPGVQLVGFEQPAVSSVVATESPASPTTRSLEDGPASAAGAMQWAEQIQRRQPDLFFDPRVRFPLAAALIRAGQSREAERMWRSQLNGFETSGWPACAARELEWQEHPSDTKMDTATWPCRAVSEPPFLDGQLDDEAWNDVQPVRLNHPSVGSEASGATEVLLAYDARFLYLAARCRTTNITAPPVKSGPRRRDTDLGSRDRLEWDLDVDRDYVTAWSFAVDDRGWANDRLSQDRTWDPDWYIATHSDAEGWSVESAIALEDLTPEPPRPGEAWRIQCQRVIPRVGRQTWPANTPVSNLPERMGLLVFE